MFIFFINIALVWAGEHAGIRPERVPLLGSPQYVEGGWTASIMDSRGGDVRVFIGKDEAESRRWFSQNARHVKGPTSFVPVDQVWGDGRDYLAFRDENLAVIISSVGGLPEELGTHMVKVVEDGVPWPQSPRIHVDGLQAKIEGSWAHVEVKCGDILPLNHSNRPVSAPNEILFVRGPTHLRLVVWDRYGRTTETEWTPPSP